MSLLTEKEKVEESYILGAGEFVYKKPIILNKFGKIVDGLHRADMDKNWPRVVDPSIDTELKTLLVMVKEHQRRERTQVEWAYIFNEIARIIERDEKLPSYKIPQRIVELSGEKLWSVQSLLKDRYKEVVTKAPKPVKPERPDNEVSDEPLPEIKPYKPSLPEKGSHLYNDRVNDMIDANIGQPISSITDKLMNIFKLNEEEVVGYIDAYKRLRGSVWNISYDNDGNPIKREPRAAAQSPPITPPAPVMFDSDPLFDRLMLFYPQKVLMDLWDKVPDSRKSIFFNQLFLELYQSCPDINAAINAVIKAS